MGRILRLRLLRCQALTWLVLLLPAIIAMLLTGGKTAGFSTEFAVLLLTTLVGILIARILTRSPSPLEAARLVERADPELNDALLTAVQVLTQPILQPTVLSQMAVEDAETLVRGRDWSRVVPRRQVFVWSLISTCCFLVMVASVMAAGRFSRDLTRSQRQTSQPGSKASPEKLSELVVEPGDTELELGSALTVVARFPNTPPEHAVLEFTNKAGQIRQMAMSETVDAGVFAARMEQISQDGTYRIRFHQPGSSTAGDVSRDYSISTFERPRLLQLDAVVTPPSWSNRPAETLEDVLRFTVTEGSQVLLRLKLNKPVATAELRPQAGSPIIVSPTTADPAILETTLVPTENQNFHLHMTDAAGRTPAEETTVSIRVNRNQPATVKPVFPGRDTNVSALQEFRVQANASDDFGLIDYGIEFTLSGGEPQQISLNQPAADHTPTDAGSTETPTPLVAAEFAHNIDLEALGAAPDDVVVYSFWAIDQAADGSPRRTVGDLLFAEVRRFEEIFREGQQQQQQQSSQQQQQQNQQQQGSAVDNVINLQKEIISATWNVVREESQRRSTGSLAEDLNAIAQSQQQAIEQLQQSLEQAPNTPQLSALAQKAQADMQQAAQLLQAAQNDPAAKPGSALPPEQRTLQTLLKMRAAEYQVRQQQQQQQQQGGGGGGGNSASQQQLQQLELDNNRNRYESERQAQEQQETTSQQREQLQVLNRLKELAQRQQAVNERLKQLESELRAATNDQQREELERELKRLRDEQREMLRDVDELNERMQQSAQSQQPENRQAQEQVQQQMQEARSNVQRASQAMDEGRLAEAIAEGTRAERQFDELREDFRNSTSSRFDDAVRDLRQQARDLNDKQNQLAQQLNGETPDNKSTQAPSLRSEKNREQISQAIQQQQDRLNQVLEQSKQLIEQAEQSEPLLSERLYDTLRETREQKPEEALKAAEMLAERGLWPQTQEAEQIARKGLQQLQQGIENAADAVLGSETEALRRAQSRLQQATDQLEQEVNDAENRQQPNADQNPQPGQQKGQQPGQQPGADQNPQPGQQSGQQPGQQPGEDQNPQPGQQSGQQPGQQPGADQNPQPGQQSGQQPGQQPGEDQNPQPGQQSGQQPGQQPGEDQNPQPGQQGGQQSGQQPGEDQNPQPGQQSGQQPGQQPGQPSGNPGTPRSSLLNGGRESARGGENNSAGRPLTGAEFSEWSDQLRDIEEMLEDPSLRNRVAQVRDRARAIRAEFRRHGTEPQWNLVRSQLLNEMQQLEQRLAEELKKRESNRAMVPIDREPVPEEFDELVQRYYQLLGQERTERP